MRSLDQRLEKQIRRLNKKINKLERRNMKRLDPRNLDGHDLRVVTFHFAVALIQTVLIGLGVEHPELAVFIQAISELLRRIVI